MFEIKFTNRNSNGNGWYHIDISKWCEENFGPEGLNDTADPYNLKKIVGRWRFMGLGERSMYGTYEIRDSNDLFLFRLVWNELIWYVVDLSL